MCCAPVLCSPDFERTFKVATDVSGRGLGAVLSHDSEGEEHPIVYLSCKLTPAKTRYSTIEREALAVKWALDSLWYYLLGAPFSLITDHTPLTWLNRMKDSNAWLTRWYLGLQPFKFQVVYKKGTANTNTDFLSRQDSAGPLESGEATVPVLPGGHVRRSRYHPSVGMRQRDCTQPPRERLSTIPDQESRNTGMTPIGHRESPHLWAWTVGLSPPGWAYVLPWKDQWGGCGGR